MIVFISILLTKVYGYKQKKKKDLEIFQAISAYMPNNQC